MSRPYVNGSFAQQGRQRRKNRIILLVALLAVLCLVGVIAAAIASQGERDPVESETLSSSSTQPPTGLAVAPPGVDGATAGGSHDHAARHEGVGTSKGHG